MSQTLFKPETHAIDLISIYVHNSFESINVMRIIAIQVKVTVFNAVHLKDGVVLIVDYGRFHKIIT